MLPWQGKGCVPFLRRALGDGARTLSFGSIFRISTIWKCPDVRERFPRSGAKYILHHHWPPDCYQVNSRGPRSSGTVSADTSKAARASSTAESRRPERRAPVLRRQTEKSSGPSGSGGCYPEILP